jgi:hypothetical protein
LTFEKKNSVSLNWPLDAQASQGNGTAFFGRGAFHQQLLTKAPFTGNDDVWTFNSQISTQWDGLRHFGYQKEGLFYNGVTMEQIHASDDKGKSTINGIQGMYLHVPQDLVSVTELFADEMTGSVVGTGRRWEGCTS